MSKGKTLCTVSDLGVTLNARVILRNINFSVRQGEIIALVGPNGSGKSILLRSLLNLVPHSGSVEWAPGIRVGYVPQSLSVDRTLPLTGYEFFTAKGIARQRIEEIITTVGIERATLSQRLGQLSSGQLQRLLIAWAIADNPDVMLFDEPTSGVDVGGQESVHDLLDRLRHERGMAILLVSHDLNVVYARADHVLCISQDLICHGPPKEVLDAVMLKRLYGTSVGLYVHHDRHEH